MQHSRGIANGTFPMREEGIYNYFKVFTLENLCYDIKKFKYLPNS